MMARYQGLAEAGLEISIFGISYATLAAILYTML
jgi:hypothetical protein